ncbi:XkdX family protein [Bacillus vallismortis]|uniref:XkdX family protein n=1 Tax=Bacillus vallismortis TaxID=72361 RepID=UPI0002898C2A|nr:XkdX family protein [Bacillus vallismortis]MCY8532567.1 XkdX family protein [Bacillus vallismortis]MCY8546442.1 XkdX family protein [Bacillus vallismortis]MEC1270922.1 XkdX family protein [Bacillus vallismortis]QAV08737.1 XkdX family protein [Bacillus vallismortis]
MNFWVIALNQEWANTEEVKIAYGYNDISKDELALGVEKGLISVQEYEAITNEDIQQ